MSKEKIVNEIFDEEESLKIRNILQKRFYTALVLILTFAIAFCVATFFCQNPLKLILGIMSVALCISFYIVWKIKKTKIKNTFKQNK